MPGIHTTTTSLRSVIASASRSLRGRLYSTAKVGVQTPTAGPSIESTPKKKRAIGGFRGGVVGFLLGATTAGAAGFLYIIDQYQKTSSLVLSSVDDLEKTSQRVKEYVQKIEAVEAELNRIQANTATKDQLLQLKADWRKQVDILSREHLELKAHMWEIEQDVDTIHNRKSEK